MGWRLGFGLAVALAVLASCTPAPRPKPEFHGNFRAVDPASGREISLVPSPVPAHDLSGKWVSPQLGTITLYQDGGSVDGTYRVNREACEVTGTLAEGGVEGNLVRFVWTDDRPDCGTAGASQGTGHFFYTRDESGPRLFGKRRLQGGEERREEIWTATLHSATTPEEDAGSAPFTLASCPASGGTDAGTRDAP
jgi:hypothetical protein